MRRSTTPRHVVRVPLRVHQRERDILGQRLRARGKLRNAVLGTLLSNLDQLRRSPAYRAALAMPKGTARSKRFAELCVQYQLTENGARRVAFDHWQASGWLTRVLDSRIALALTAEVLTEVKAHWFRRPPALQALERL